MDSMDNFHERFEALERRTQIVEQRLRWWRGIACGFLLLGLLAWALPSGRAADAQSGTIADQLAALRDILAVIRFNAAANEVVITGVNLRIVNGLGTTDTTNGLGNLLVGYNELRGTPLSPDVRTGSHNVVVGQRHNFSRFGGLVVGDFNTISGDFAVVSGGSSNTASNMWASVSGGADNTASGDSAWVRGGSHNEATTFGAAVSGGEDNVAAGRVSSVSGGSNRSVDGEFDWAAGDFFSDM